MNSMQFSSHANSHSVRVSRTAVALRFVPLSIFVATGITLTGCGTSPPNKPNDSGGSSSVATEAAAPVENPRNSPLNAAKSAHLTVISKPSGCMIYVDMVPVRNEGDGLALTPCEFELPQGRHTISVEKPGGRRKTEAMMIDHDQELDFDVSSTPGDYDDPSLLNAPLFDAAVGRSIALDSLNSSGQELDPFVTADGLTIYFVSDRGGDRGVYTATRPSPYHNFGEPKTVAASMGADMPSSPSVSGDGLVLVYVVTDKSRIWQLTRIEATAPFGAKEIIRNDENAERPWCSAQLSDDALRLYWTEETGDSMVTRAAVRSGAGKLFGKTLAFDLPGHHPHVSSDGMRQFVFDGEKLLRSRRGSSKQPFSEPELVAELSLENYVVSQRHRQFWVSDDEQWMIYSTDPKRSGDLYIVRLSDGPGWGRQFTAKSVADKTAVAMAEPEEKPSVEAMPQETVDPRTLPLAYTTHWTKLTKLLTERDNAGAVDLVNQSRKKPEMSSERQLLEWDLELAQSQVEFDQDVERALTSLKPGTAVRVAGTRFEFVRYEGDVLYLKIKDKEFTKKTSDLSPGERVSLADSGGDKADAAKAFRFGIFLYFQGPTQHSIADSWFKRAGSAGAEFFERLARRTLVQALAELSRGNVAAGMALLDNVPAVGGPNTKAAEEAAKERNNLFDRLVWTPVGSRQWQRGELGEFTADSLRSNGSYLRSDRKYGDFEIRCEWKVSGKTSMGGIFLRFSGEGKLVEKGTKIQLASKSDVSKMDPFVSGGLFGSTAPTLDASLPDGKWNTLRVQVRGNNVQAWINDKDVLQTTLGKGIPTSGYVLLDGAVGGISYRKVLVFDLAPAP